MVVEKAKALGLDTLFENVAIGYVIFFLVVLGLVVWRNKTNKTRVIWGGVVFFVFALLPYRLFIYQTPVEKTFALEQEAQRIEYKAKYEAAKPIFDKLCKEQSAPIMKRTVEDVEGVLLLKVRRESDHNDWKNQMWEGAGLDSLPGGDAYIRYFLYDRKLDDEYTNKIRQTVDATNRRSYRFADVRNEQTGSIARTIPIVDAALRSRHGKETRFVTQSLAGPPARYAIDLVENVDPDLRKHWVAGTTIKIIDTTTTEVIAQQTWWNWDTGFGNTNGSRSPWITSNQRCPRYAFKPEEGHKFIDSVLKAKQGDKP